MNLENTLNRFKLISGLDTETVSNWRDLVSDSREYLDSIVTKEDIYESDEKRLDNAAAVYAYYKYLSYTISEETSFSAGDLKVSYNNEKIKAAKEMWEAELESIKDIVNFDNSVFVFKRVI